MKRKRWGGVLGCAALLLFALTAFLPARSAYAAEGNLALHKQVAADSKEAESVRPELAVDGNTTGRDSRWGSALDQAHGAHWIYVDLGENTQVSSVKVYWEARKATGFKIQVASAEDAAGKDSTSWKWKDVYSSGRPDKLTSVVNFEPVQARYVRLYITGFEGKDPDGKVDTWDTVSIFELEVYADKQEVPVEPTNLAAGKQVTVSKDYGNTAQRLTDGSKDAKTGRWMTEQKPTQWAYVDLGSEQQFDRFIVTWENDQNYAEDFALYVSKDGEHWNSAVASMTGNKNAANTVKLEAPVTARYVKLEVTKVAGWQAVSCCELEVWNGEPPAPDKKPVDYLNDIVVDPVTADTTKLSYKLPEAPKGYEIKYNGTDYEQVIDLDGTVYHPIADVNVKASFKIASTTNPSDFAFKEFDIKVPGTMTAQASANAAPQVLPELREWVGGQGSFKAGVAKRVVYGQDSLKAMAQEFADDYQVITGVKVEVVSGSSAQAGDIFFTLGADKAWGLKEEGYRLEVTADRMTVTAEAVAGANWGGKTILQGMKSSDDVSFPVGVARDYPLYKVRGIILDVGRKAFTLDWLKQMTKQMSFYKMNDFQIHLNDNYIFLEEYTSQNRDVFDAYSAFRLESDVKKGGNGGKNQADLTSKDVWYSKKDFKDYIEQSHALGVNIVPEIDTPAHSLAFTKVRPDLRHGTNGRENDHLDIAKQYDASLGFVQSVFDEYVKGGQDAVFADADTIHIGADEYSASPDAYRNFVNDMFKYAESNGKKARVWGSLSQIKGDSKVAVKGVSEDGKHHREIQLWNPGWADLKEMYTLGFDLIDCQDGVFYIVPNAGYYYDYLNDAAYTDPLNAIGNMAIPAGDPQVSGGAFAVWNDMCGDLENGISEYDVYDRIDHSLGLFAANSWGKGKLSVGEAKQVVSKLGDSPNVNFGYHADATEDGVLAHWNMDSLKDSSSMGRDLVEGENAQITKVDGKNALELRGGASYVSVKDNALTTVGLGNDLRVKVKRTSDSDEPQVLFESEYGQIMAVQKGTGAVGITRENHAYSFNYTLPVGEWVELEFKNEFEQVSLYVNGTRVDTIGDGEKAGRDRPLKATTMLPVQRIGSKKHAFIGCVDDVRLGSKLAGDAEFASTMNLDYVLMEARSVLDSKDVTGDLSTLRALVDEAQRVIDSYNPAKAKIDELTAKIADELGKLDYAKADYSRVDAYLSIIPDDETLNAYYDASDVAALKNAVSSVRRNLPALQQERVNQYERSLVRALDAMSLLETKDLNLIDPALLTAKADCENPDGKAQNVLDGNLGSIWHSDYTSSSQHKAPHWIQLESKEPMDVNALVYTPRQTGNNGNLIKYKISVSTDGEKFTDVGEEAELKNVGTDPITISFPVQKGVKVVRLHYLKTVNDFASAAELRLNNASVKGDFEGLAQIVEFAKGVKHGEGVTAFTDETWKAFADELEKAQKVLADQAGTVEEVHAQKQSLLTSLIGLRLVENPNPGPNPGPDPNPNPNPNPNPGPNPSPNPNPGPNPGPHPGGSGSKPSKPGNGLPQTGDDTMPLVLGMSATAVVAIAAGAVARRRQVH